MSKYIFYLLLTSALLLASSTLLAQPTTADDAGRFEQIRLARQEFITAELQLTSEESKRFFPVFWEYEAQIHRLRKQQYRSHSYREDGSQGERAAISEKAAKEMLENRLATEAELLTIKRKAVEDYLQLIPASKLILLDKAEHTFRRKLVDRVHEKRDGRF